MPSLPVLGPAARRAVLSRVLLDPSREFHVRELVRLTGLAPRTVHQEIEKLVRADLLVERRESNRRYVQANRRHPLFRPLREIILKTDGLADVLREALGSEGVELAFVYGSIAAAEPSAESDVDLMIVGSLGLREAVRRLGPAHDALGREINPSVWTKQEFDRRRQEQDPFLTRILAGSTIAVVGAVPDENHEP
jgi:DNA-binding transcriptional ArsR family regulator